MGAPREMRRRRCIRRERTRRNATTNDDEKTTLVPRRRPTDPPRPRDAPRAPLPSPSRKSNSQRTSIKKVWRDCRRAVFSMDGNEGRLVSTRPGRVDPIASGGKRETEDESTRVRTPAPWIEHGILSLRRRAPVSNARRSKAWHSFTSARVGTRLTRYHCAIQARVHRDDRRVSTPSRGTHGTEHVVHGSRRMLWVRMEGLGRIYVGFRGGAAERGVDTVARREVRGRPSDRGARDVGGRRRYESCARWSCRRS